MLRLLEHEWPIVSHKQYTRMHGGHGFSPALGRNQRWGFKADINGTSAGSEATLWDKTWQELGKTWKQQIEREEGPFEVQ